MGRCAPPAARAAGRTVQLDQIEGVKEGAGVMPAIADAVEEGDAVVTAHHCLSIDDTGVRAQSRERLDDEREAVGQVIARPTVGPAIGCWLIPMSLPRGSSIPAKNFLGSCSLNPALDSGSNLLP
jgi:hypothetical protein